MIKHIAIQVFGQVQAVGFRYYTQKQAEQLAITGSIRNQPDGSVYIEAEGEQDNLEKLVAWCQQGPDYAKVNQVRVTPGTVKNYNRFDIL